MLKYVGSFRSSKSHGSPMMLFNAEDLQIVNPSNNSSQNTSINIFPDDDNRKTRLPFRTPLVQTKPALTPGAPIKQKPPYKTKNLKPKKLVFEEMSDFRENSSENTPERREERGRKWEETESQRMDSAEKENFNCNHMSPVLQTRLRRRKPVNNESKNNNNPVGNRKKIEEAKPQSKTNDRTVKKLVNKKSNAADAKKQYPGSRKLDSASSKGFNPDRIKTRLSYFNENGDWIEHLQWLQPRRDVGLWIQCCRKGCEKWRYEENYHDPVDVPELWFCEMNSDITIANCNAPEVPIPPEVEDDLIENKFNAGSIVWARTRGFPWWPAMVDDSPDTLSFYKLKGNDLEPVEYNVMYFDKERVERGWVKKNNILPFVSHSKRELVKKTVFKDVDYKDRLEEACKLAQSALPLSIYDRLKKFSLLALTNNYGTLQDSNTESMDTVSFGADDHDDLNETIPNSQIDTSDYTFLSSNSNKRRKVKN